MKRKVLKIKNMSDSNNSQSPNTGYIKSEIIYINRQGSSERIFIVSNKSDIESNNSAKG